VINVDTTAKSRYIEYFSE